MSVVMARGWRLLCDQAGCLAQVRSGAPLSLAGARRALRKTGARTGWAHAPDGAEPDGGADYCPAHAPEAAP